MASTTYTVFANDVALEGTKSKKATAVELAKTVRADQRVAVRVETSTGTVVFEQAAPKTIKMSPQYTRTVELPEGFRVPAGFRVAYTRNRKGIAIAHNAETGEYRVINAKGHALAKNLETTRAAGAFCKTVEAPAKETVDA